MPEAAPHILIVDDDPRLRTMLRRYLEDEGFRILEAENGEAMRRRMNESRVDLVLLDVVMPGEDGFALARELGGRPDLGVIMLTGRSDLVDRVVGLEVGADDYIAKPFELREVLARIRTVLRRLRGAAAAAPAPAQPAPASKRLTFEGWRLDVARRQLSRPDGADVALTGGEFDLLLAFAERPNRVLDRDLLMDLVKGRGWEAYDRSIDTQVSRLRKKIEADPANPTLIKSVRGAGYVFAAEVREDRS
jgi:two-component system phosphate regulon response regulator OmpR